MASQQAEIATPSPSHVTIITSYTHDYAIGPLCAKVNAAYAARHGYDFISVPPPPFLSVMPTSAPRDSAAGEQRHPTWTKAWLIHSMLQALLGRPVQAGPPSGNAAAPACAPRTTHIMWIDADAVVLRQHVSVEQVLAQLPARAELVVGEDLTRACLLNAGVLVARVSAWSAALWADVWGCEQRWWDTPKHEQSALLKASA
jgi:hypothetical protein